LSCPHEGFLVLLPTVQQNALIVFRHLPRSDREEACAEATASAFQSYVRLKAQGKNPAAFRSMLATFAARAVASGRHVGGRSTTRDVLAAPAQRRHGFRVRSLAWPGEHWSDILCDNSQTPVPDQVAFRIDFPQWLSTLSARDRRMAEELSLGHAAHEIAQRFHLSRGRVTQLRRRWQREWLAFCDEDPHKAGCAHSSKASA
jgi:hypothetical protein